MESATTMWVPLGVLVLALIAGRLTWPAIEYLVHGVLAHRFRTFVSPLHWTHHRDPRAVFTSPAAVVPGALVVLLAAQLLLGAAAGACFAAGVVWGFFHYEYVHWRIHFRAPRNAREERLRRHHLAHHHRNPRAYHGVTTRFWDRVGGTLPERWEEDYARVAERPVLEGSPGFLAAYGHRWSPFTWVRELSRARRSG